MQGPWEAMLTFPEGAKLKDARQNVRMRARARVCALYAAAVNGYVETPC